MTSQALNSALTGLRIAQQQLGVISNNVANATTPGYTRKILPQSTQVVNSTGEVVGVRSDILIRKVDLNLERQMWTQVSSVEATNAKASYLDRIEKFHGSSNSEQSIAAEIADLKDKFAALSDSPGDGYLLQSTLNQAEVVARKFNDFANLITELRNEAQDEISTTVNRVNDLLKTISGLNADIRGMQNVSKPTAALEDSRDTAIKELSGLMGITTYMRGDGVLVVQTVTGVQLCDEAPEEVYFDPGVLGTSTSYPDTAAGLYVGGNPDRYVGSVDITATDVSGKLGGLIDLRDNTLVQYQAQLDELAHKTALRLSEQGLSLFTGPSGTIPVDTPPDLTTDPPTPVAYVGFASLIQVNPAITNNVALLQQGTYASDKTIPSASNEVIRRVIQYGFGDISYQQAAGTTDLNVAAPATDLQDWLGLHSENNVIAGINLKDFPQISDGVAGTSDLMEDLQEFFPGYPNNDQFQITFSEPRLGLGPTTVTIDLSDAQTNYPIGGTVTNALDQVIAEINNQITLAGVAPGLAAVATSNAYGQLEIQSRGNIQISASGFANAMGTSAFSALGWSEGTYATEDPYFDVQVGNDTPVRITIAPGDDVNDLISKLEYNPATGQGVPGLSVELDTATGYLTLRPGMDQNNGGPRFGGDIKLIGGPAMTSGAVNPALAALPSSIGIVSALFGSYSVSGGTAAEYSPVADVKYASETAVGSGVYVSFRQKNLGAGAGVNTNILTGMNLLDYSQKMINTQAQDVILNNTEMSDSTALRDMLTERLTNESGVNVDEELSNLVLIQTAYAAAARAVTAASEMFDDLLNAF